MRKFLHSFMIVACVMGLTSCVTIPSKQARGNLEIRVSPLSKRINATSSTEQHKTLYPYVYVGKKFIGHATLNKPILYLKRGKYKVRVELEGYETWEKEIDLLGNPSQQILYVQLKETSAE